MVTDCANWQAAEVQSDLHARTSAGRLRCILFIVCGRADSDMTAQLKKCRVGDWMTSSRQRPVELDVPTRGQWEIAFRTLGAQTAVKTKEERRLCRRCQLKPTAVLFPYWRNGSDHYRGHRDRTPRRKRDFSRVRGVLLSAYAKFSFKLPCSYSVR